MAIDRERLGAARILVVGDVMLDRYWHGDVDRISPEAPVQVVRMRREECRLGGAGNVARNVVSLGATAELMGIVGDDEASTQLQGLLREDGIGDSLFRDGGAPTTVKLRINGRSQQLLRVDFEEQPSIPALDEVERHFAGRCVAFQAIVLSDYGKGGLTRVSRKIEVARFAGIPVLVDPKGHDYSAYRGASVLTPNRQELAHVVGPWSDEDHLAELAFGLRRELDLGAILLTRSEEGMSLFDEAGKVDIPAQAREVFDVTGAGDTVIATLAALIGAGYTLRDALPYANRAGGIVVGKFGTATIDAEELFA